MDSEAPSEHESILLRVLRVGVLAYLGVLVLLVVFQRQLIYFPTRQSLTDALQQAGELHLLPWKTARGDLIGWRSPNPVAKARMLIFHGNGGCAQDRSYYIDLFSRLKMGSGWDYAIFEYPGYGARPGKPGEKEFKEAAREALKQLREEDSRPVVILGESLGSGVACALAAENGATVPALLLMTPFTSLTEVASHHYPFFPVKTLLGDRYDNLSALGKYQGRLAVVLAGSDEVVPVGIGRRLYDSYAGKKQLWLVPQATHNGVVNRIAASDLEAIAGFLQESVSTPVPRK